MGFRWGDKETEEGVEKGGTGIEDPALWFTPISAVVTAHRLKKEVNSGYKIPDEAEVEYHKKTNWKKNESKILHLSNGKK